MAGINRRKRQDTGPPLGPLANCDVIREAFRKSQHKYAFTQLQMPLVRILDVRLRGGTKGDYWLRPAVQICISWPGVTSSASYNQKVISEALDDISSVNSRECHAARPGNRARPDANTQTHLTCKHGQQSVDHIGPSPAHDLSSFPCFFYAQRTGTSYDIGHGNGTR